jgi:hypothetical protein
MSWISLQTSTGSEEYQVSDLDEVVWWKTENGIAVGKALKTGKQNDHAKED